MKSLLVKLGVVIVVLCLFCPINSFAGRDSIWFAGMEVKIGMGKDAVLSKIAKDYLIFKSDVGEDMWSVYSRESRNHVGVVAFKDEKVHVVSKSWGIFSKDQGFEFATNIFNLLSNLEAEGNKVIYFNTESRKQPNVSFQIINFFFDGKQVNIIKAEYLLKADYEKYGNNISINEKLGK